MGGTDPYHETAETVEAVWHNEAARVIALVSRLTRDMVLAEEFAQDALVAALEKWPLDGIPDNPGAWLVTIARRRALDYLRHRAQAAPKHEQLAHDLEFRHESRREDLEERVDSGLDDDIGDDLLRLIFTACHPVLSSEMRSTLTLRVIGGLTTDEIARALFKPVPTIAQRIVRAKRTIAEARIPFEIPRGNELEDRLTSVLEVIYLMFNEGYTATSGERWSRPELCEEALRLGRILAELVPAEPEVHGLVALMEIQASRLDARVDDLGFPVLLPDQDRRRWDRQLIRRGLAALARAEAISRRPGSYALQAAIAACHARAESLDNTDWVRITALYDALSRIASSPVVELNRAVAVGRAHGPTAGLAIVDELLADGRLANYHLLPSVRGDLLLRLDRIEEARAEFHRAAGLTQNRRERQLLLTRARHCTRC